MKRKGKRILYGVSGEGRGHAMRSSVIIGHLLKDHEVMIIGYDRSFEFLSSMFKNVHNIKGFNIVYENNCVNNRKTLTKFLKELPSDIRSNGSFLYKAITNFRPHIIITDIEPFSNMISKLRRIPLVSIDNQSIITKTRISVPRRFYADKLFAASVIRCFISRPKEYLITTFFHPPVKPGRPVKLFPPILRDHILKKKPEIKDHILVYQTSKSYSRLASILKKTGQKFIIYGFDKEKTEKNLVFRKFNNDIFYKEFASCKAVIANGGFGLIGEALHLKKPILSIPVRKQFEQVLNALYLEKLGFGEFHEDLDPAKLNSFLSCLETYRHNIKEKHKETDNSKILKAVDELIEKYSKRYKDEN